MQLFKAKTSTTQSTHHQFPSTCNWRKNMRISSLIVAFGLIVGMSVTSAQAALLVYEPFDYPDTATLDGQNGGIGFGGAWAPSESGRIPAEIGTGSLGGAPVPAGVATSGNHAIAGDGTSGTQQEDERSLGTTMDGFQDDGDTLWLSVIAQKTGGPNNQAFGALLLMDGGADNFVMGIRDPAQGKSDNWSLGHRAGNTVFDSTGTSTTTLSWLVMRIDYNDGAEDVYLWVNPDPGTEPLIANADASETGQDFTFDWIEVSARNDITGVVDEIRIGTEFADMSIVPEPTSLTASLALIGLGLLRRRGHG